MAETTTHAPDREAIRLRNAIRALVRRFSVSERADVSCCGMTVAQAATLEVLRAEGPLRLGSLRRRLGISASTLTRNLDRLEARGLVRRSADEGDGRAVRAVLTAAGESAAGEVARQEIEFAREIFERVPTERREEIPRSLEDLLVAVRDATESCCGGAFDHLMEEFPRRAAEPARPEDTEVAR